MTAIDRDRARAAFKSYTDAYDATNPRIALKIEHTYHVAEACDAVAREQGWSSEDIDLAWLCGLLHDMGRFEQLRRWDTFKDAESMSHAALGIEVLFGENPADAPAVTSIRDFIDDPAAPSTPSSRWTRRRFSAAVSRRRHLPPLTSTAASHAMNATSPQTTWWDSSALCLSSSIQQAARWRANRAISTACSTRPLALHGPLPTPPRRQPGAA